MNRAKNMVWLPLAAALLLAMAGCGASNAAQEPDSDIDARLLGTWVYVSDASNKAMLLFFGEDGKGYIGGDIVEWSAKNGGFAMSVSTELAGPAETTTGTYSLDASGKTLTLTPDEDVAPPMEFTKLN